MDHERGESAEPQPARPLARVSLAGLLRPTLSWPTCSSESVRGERSC